MAADEPTLARLHEVESETRQFRTQLAERGITIEYPDDEPINVGLKQIDQAVLREMEQRTRQRDEAHAYAESIVETMRSPLLLLDPELQIVGANRAFYSFFQVSADDVLGRSIIMRKESRWAFPELQDLFAGILTENGGYSSIEITRDFPRIGQRTLRCNARRITPTHEAPPRIVVVIEDVTPEIERERLLDELERYAAELETTLSAIPDALVIYNADGALLHMNRQAASWFGPSQYDDVVAQFTLPLFTAEGKPLPTVATPSARALNGEDVRNQVLRLHVRDGQMYWVSVSAAPIRTVGQRLLGAVVTLTDITTVNSLQEQQRGIIQMVSHDLRVPLTVMHGHLQLLEEEIESSGIDGDIRTSLTAVDLSIQRMRVMIQDLVDAAHGAGGELRLDLQPIALRIFVRELLRRSRLVMDIDRFQVKISPAVPPVWADPDRLERILMNLLSNAVKYAAPGTPVIIEAHEEGNVAVVNVTDQGPGIAPEDVPHIFERFYRAKGAHKAEGIGLGLYITRTLVEAHGGHIWVKSTPGQGSTFTFTLPFA